MWVDNTIFSYFFQLLHKIRSLSAHINNSQKEKDCVLFLTRVPSMRRQSKYVSGVVSTHINIEICIKLYKTIKTSRRGPGKSLILILVRLNIRFDKLKEKISLRKKNNNSQQQNALPLQSLPPKNQGRRA